MKICIHFSFIALLLSSIHGSFGQEDMVLLKELSSEFSFEIRYATENNFLGKVLYECDDCLLQRAVAQALLDANQYFCELGYRIKLYDCYRPLDVQKAMWEELPNPTYIANPYEQGSVHNRGAAVDLTLETLEGCYVDMGSDYDHFGLEAHIDNLNLPKQVLENRKLLQEGMRKFGFQPIRTEWWHFGHVTMYRYPLSNTPFPCIK